MESYTCASSGAELSRFLVRHLSTGLDEPVKAIIPQRPVSGLVDLYEYVW